MREKERDKEGERESDWNLNGQSQMKIQQT